MKNSPSIAALLFRPSAFPDLPIKHKLMAIIMAVSIAVLITSGLSLVVFDVLVYRGYLKRDLTGLASITADNTTAALSFDDPASAAQTLAALRARTHVVAACIYRSDDTLFTEYLRPGEGTACPPPGEVDQIRFLAGYILVSQPILLTGRRIGTLMLRYDLDELYGRLRLYGTAVLGVLLLSGFFAYLLSSRLQELVATPITELAKTTADVSATRDYGIRAEKLTRDELGILVDGFNDMLSGIQSRDQELRQALVAREDALQAARNARDFLRTTLASIGDAVLSADAEGRIVFANPVASSLTGWPENEIAGRHVDEVLRLINENTRGAVESPVARVLREGAMVALANHTILVARDGAEIPIDDSAAPIRNERGELIGAVMIFRDITERRRAEQELRSAREQLQLVTDTMASAVSHCSRDFRYLWVSPRFASWLGCRSADMKERLIEEVIGAEAFATIHPYLERVLAGEDVEYEAKVNYASIGPRWIHAVYVPTHGRDGIVNGWVSHIADITALKDAEAEVVRVNTDLQKINERLARSNRDLEGFAFAASHDLQEPLRMITAYTQLLVRTHPTQFEGDASLYIRNIVDGATRMRALLTDLLAYSEISADTDQPMAPVDLNAVIETVRQNLKVAAEEAGATIVADNLPTVNGYTGHFVQLFQNLVGNAIKYRGERPPIVQISWVRIDRQLRFAVTDNGMGIEPEYHIKIFGVFKRLHGKKIPGTGIGLALCQRVVERHRGRIWVESQAGHGSTFYFTLPQGVEIEGGIS